MSKHRNAPIALTIAGSDSGGGAGIQADLKTFASLGVHGTSAVTCITAQNPEGVRGIQAVHPRIVRQQIDAIFDAFQPAAVKTGMLFSTEIIRVVVNFFKNRTKPPLIVDPVMVATSGARLLQTSAVKAMRDELLPRATLVTPNLDEAAVLVGRRLQSIDDLRAAARDIQARYGCAALVKGGHLKGMKEAADFFYDGRTELLLTAPFIRSISTHGTGCVYAAAVAGYLALGRGLAAAVELAKQYITHAIARSVVADGHSVLNSFGTREGRGMNRTGRTRVTAPMR